MQVGTSLTCDVSGPESLFQTQVERQVGTSPYNLPVALWG